MHLPFDYTRINQFPEWFVIRGASSYELKLDQATPIRRTGGELARGLELSLKAGQTRLLELQLVQ